MGEQYKIMVVGKEAEREGTFRVYNAKEELDEIFYSGKTWNNFEDEERTQMITSVALVKSFYNSLRATLTGTLDGFIQIHPEVGYDITKGYLFERKNCHIGEVT